MGSECNGDVALGRGEARWIPELGIAVELRVNVWDREDLSMPAQSCPV